ncbi:MAG: CheB methylesterase domain-containing protein, partial [Kofleriaceae bacterium]
DALAAGAVDVLEKPRGDEIDSVWETRYRAALKLVSRIKVITHLRARLGTLGRSPTPLTHVLPPASPQPVRAIAIGVSTGGPAAIVEILRELRAPGVPILLVLHIDEPFSSAFAEWLDGQTSHRVSYARDGEPLATIGSRVVMAPPGRHMITSGGRVMLTADAPRHSCRPSVDVLFESLARDCGGGVIACLLTGMGRDGASGLLEIRRAGGLTIAQDEASCVVYGMPREAALLGAAERVLPLSEIGPAITKLFATSPRRPR